MRARRRAAAILAAVAIAAAAAAPGAIVWPDLACPHGVFPLRLAAFQAPPGTDLDLDVRLQTSGFRHSRAVANLGSEWGAVHLVVLVYAGNLSTSVVLEVRDPSGAVTWSYDAPLSPPHPGVAASTVHPSYVVVELPRSTWPEAFPEDGLYTLRAAPPEDRGRDIPIEPPCGAETTSWLYVAR